MYKDAAPLGLRTAPVRWMESSERDCGRSPSRSGGALRRALGQLGASSNSGALRLVLRTQPRSPLSFGARLWAKPQSQRRGTEKGVGAAWRVLQFGRAAAGPADTAALPA